MEQLVFEFAFYDLFLIDFVILLIFCIIFVFVIDVIVIIKIHCSICLMLKIEEINNVTKLLKTKSASKYSVLSDIFKLFINGMISSVLFL